MSFDSRCVADSFSFDGEEVAELRRRWLSLLDRAVWDDLSADKLGALPRLRKRMLELGENLRSVIRNKDWIPHPREQIKSATAACLSLRESLLNLERAAKHLSKGEDVREFESDLIEFRRRLLTFVERHEARWCRLLESQYDGRSEED